VGVDSPTGILFDEQSVSSIVDAVAAFERCAPPLSAEACRKNAQQFSVDRFRNQYRSFVEAEWAKFAARDQ
jgi:hypothetical protein